MIAVIFHDVAVAVAVFSPVAVIAVIFHDVFSPVAVDVATDVWMLLTLLLDTYGQFRLVFSILLLANGYKTLQKTAETTKRENL